MVGVGQTSGLRCVSSHLWQPPLVGQLLERSRDRRHAAASCVSPGSRRTGRRGTARARTRSGQAGRADGPRDLPARPARVRRPPPAAGEGRRPRADRRRTRARPLPPGRATRGRPGRPGRSGGLSSARSDPMRFAGPPRASPTSSGLPPVAACTAAASLRPPKGIDQCGHLGFAQAGEVDRVDRGQPAQVGQKQVQVGVEVGRPDAGGDDDQHRERARSPGPDGGGRQGWCWSPTARPR